MNKFLCIVVFAISLVACDIGFGQRGGRGRFGGGSGERVEPEDLKFEMGVPAIKDAAMYEKLSYKGTDVGRDSYLADIQYVKFIIENPQTDDAKLYFMNTANHRAHPPYTVSYTHLTLPTKA